jgi:hypothetical protein
MRVDRIPSIPSLFRISHGSMIELEKLVPHGWQNCVVQRQPGTDFNRLALGHTGRDSMKMHGDEIVCWMHDDAKR